MQKDQIQSAAKEGLIFNFKLLDTSDVEVFIFYPKTAFGTNPQIFDLSTYNYGLEKSVTSEKINLYDQSKTNRIYKWINDHPFLFTNIKYLIYMHLVSIYEGYAIVVLYLNTSNNYVLKIIKAGGNLETYEDRNWKNIWNKLTITGKNALLQQNGISIL